MFDNRRAFAKKIIDRNLAVCIDTGRVPRRRSPDRRIIGTAGIWRPCCPIATRQVSKSAVKVDVHSAIRFPSVEWKLCSDGIIRRHDTVLPNIDYDIIPYDSVVITNCVVSVIPATYVRGLETIVAIKTIRRNGRACAGVSAR